MNRVTLCGNLGNDPEVSTLPSGTMMAKASLATSERYLDKVSGEWKETTEWHRLVFWEGLAKVVGDYLKKGSKILVEGRIKYGQYTGNDGITRYTTDIVVREMIMIGKSESGDSGDSGYNQRNQSGNNYSQSSSSDYKQMPSTGSMIADQLAGALTPDEDDVDIPF